MPMQYDIFEIGSEDGSYKLRVEYYSAGTYKILFAELNNISRHFILRNAISHSRHLRYTVTSTWFKSVSLKGFKLAMHASGQKKARKYERKVGRDGL